MEKATTAASFVFAMVNTWSTRRLADTHCRRRGIAQGTVSSGSAALGSTAANPKMTAGPSGELRTVQDRRRLRRL